MAKRLINEDALASALKGVKGYVDDKSSGLGDIESEINNLLEEAERLEESVKNITIESLNGVEEAPADDKYYVRHNKSWVDLDDLTIGSGGGTNTDISGYMLINENKPYNIPTVNGCLGLGELPKIIENIHLYVGKHTAKNTMTICRISDEDHSKFLDGSNISEITVSCEEFDSQYEDSYTVSLDFTKNGEKVSFDDYLDEGDVFVKLPTFYYRINVLNDGLYNPEFKMQENSPGDDWIKWDGNELIAAYHAFGYKKKLTSKRGLVYWSGSNSYYYEGISSKFSHWDGNVKQFANNRGSGYDLFKHKHWSILYFLFLMYYGREYRTNGGGDFGMGNPGQYTTYRTGQGTTHYVTDIFGVELRTSELIYDLNTGDNWNIIKNIETGDQYTVTYPDDDKDHTIVKSVDYSKGFFMLPKELDNNDATGGIFASTFWDTYITRYDFNGGGTYRGSDQMIETDITVGGYYSMNTPFSIKPSRKEKDEFYSSHVGDIQRTHRTAICRLTFNGTIIEETDVDKFKQIKNYDDSNDSGDSNNGDTTPDETITPSISIYGNGASFGPEGGSQSATVTIDISPSNDGRWNYWSELESQTSSEDWWSWDGNTVTCSPNDSTESRYGFITVTYHIYRDSGPNNKDYYDSKSTTISCSQEGRTE